MEYKDHNSPHFPRQFNQLEYHVFAVFAFFSPTINPATFCVQNTTFAGRVIIHFHRHQSLV
jgi:hypothetical protein